MVTLAGPGGDRRRPPGAPAAVRLCNTRIVSRPRTLLALLIVLGLSAAVGPSLALAGGGSAGDNQYVDPLTGVHSHSGSHSSSTSSTPAPASTTQATAAATTPATTTAPTATTAATTTDASGKTKALPFTGFADWQAAGLGALLLAGGLALRRRTTS